jgi:hypothetical protein
MQSPSRLPWLLGVLLVGGLGEPARALPHWNPRPAGPATAYRPEMRHFVVVSPTPVVHAGVPLAAAGAPVGTEAVVEPPAALPSPPPARRLHHAARAASPPPLLWRQQIEPVPEYPWGWFGARRHTANTGHRRYYGGEFDWSLRRGD